VSRKLSTQVVTLAVLASLGGSVSAQQAPPPAAGSQSQPAKPAEAQPPAAAPATGPGYSYVREGRRDPFVSLVGRGTGTPGETRPSGLGGMLINEISLKGIMRQSGGFVALVQGTDKKTYVVRQGQKLMDGTVKSITEDTVVFSQDVNDPLSLVKQREVRKTLRSSEEGRG
jgi:Tfp pilus assembly protein PilP